MKNRVQFIGGAVVSYMTIAFQIISGLIYIPWMINKIGSDYYALYTLATSIISIFMMDFGVGGAVSKFLADFYAKEKYEKANEFLGVIYEVFICISFFIGICLFIFFLLIDKIEFNLTSSELIIFKHLFIIVSVYSVCFFPFSTFNGILTANEQFAWLKLCNLLQNIFNVILIVLCLLLNFGVYSLVIVHCITNLITILFKYTIIKRKTRVNIIFSKPSRELIKNIFDFSFFMTINSLAQRCIFNIMPSIISVLLNNDSVTMFSIAVTLEGYTYTFTQAINGMFLPKISRIKNNDKSEIELYSLMCYVGKFHVWTLGLLYIGFILLGEMFIDLWLGHEYNLVYICALILIFPSLIDTPQQVAKTALVVNDILKEQTYIYVGMAIINIVLANLLIKWFGLVGAAVSICFAYLFRTCFFNYLYAIRLKLDLNNYFKTVYSKWIIVFSLTIIINLCILSSFQLIGWIGFILKGFIVVLIYTVLLFMISYNDVIVLVKRILKN